MSKLIPFQYNSSAVRVVTADNGEILFLARDVATALGYKNPAKAYQNHCKRLIKLDYNDLIQLNYDNPHPKGEYFIKDTDVYRLTLRSKAEHAEVFQDWVCDEVIPSIKKTGSYSTGKGASGRSVPRGFAEALQLAADQQREIEAKNKLILASNEASIKAGEILVREFCKAVDVVDIGEKRFYSWMREQGFLMKESCQPYQHYVDRGLFTWKPSEELYGGKYRYTLRITPKGKLWLTGKYMDYLDVKLLGDDVLSLV